MPKIGLGVIGLGRMGQVYGYHAARQIETADLVAIADSRAEVTERFAENVGGITTYNTHSALLEDARVQAVIIATPTSTHRDIVIDAAHAGKAIFCEKPTALTLSATDEMISAVEAAQVLFQVGFMRRFDRGYMAAKERIDAGLIGQPVTIRSVSRDPFRTSLEYADPQVSGGIIVDMAIHDFDVVRWMMSDDLTRVYTESASIVYPELVEVGDVDNAMINLKFAGGGVGNIEASRTAYYGYDIQCDIIGSKGALRVGYLQETPVLLLNREGVHHDVVPHFPERFGRAYTAQLEHFVECVRLEQQPKVTYQDARAALQASIAATISQQEGRVVEVASVG